HHRANSKPARCTRDPTEEPSELGPPARLGATSGAGSDPTPRRIHVQDLEGGWRWRCGREVAQRGPPDPDGPPGELPREVGNGDRDLVGSRPAEAVRQELDLRQAA